MVAFYRSSSGWETGGDIWLRLLPDGDPIQVTHDARAKYNIAFSPDGARIAYTVFPRASRLFDTYTVSTLGGNSQLFLPNSAGLSWLDDKHLLFSQIKGPGIHMGIVTSDSDRSGLREIYFPSLERGMAHYSHLSPDRKWILLEEMNPVWGPCRVVPFSGDSPGRLVGPPGAVCISASWSHDGKYMSLGAQVDGRYHNLASAVPGWPAGTDHLRLQRRIRNRIGARRPVLYYFSAHPPKRGLVARFRGRPRGFHRRLRGHHRAGVLA
jgi:hypothetical protein